jgi:hypothetical protein
MFDALDHRAAHQLSRVQFVVIVPSYANLCAEPSHPGPATRPRLLPAAAAPDQ